MASKPLAAATAAGSTSPPAATTSARTCLACVGVTVPASSSVVSAASAVGVTGRAFWREVVLDVDEHPGRIAPGLDGARSANPSRPRSTAMATASLVASTPAAAARVARRSAGSGGRERRISSTHSASGTRGTRSGSGK